MNRLTTIAEILAGILLLIAALAGPVYAGDAQSATLMYYYDVDSTSPTYCSSSGMATAVWGGGIPGVGKIQTSGSSTTWNGVTGAADSFGPLAAGDFLVAKRNQQTSYLRVVVTRTSADSIVVDSAAALSDYSFEWWDVTCGTDAEAGWFNVGGYDSVLISYDISQISTTTGGIDITPQCRQGGPGSPVQTVTSSGSADNKTAAAIGYYSVVLFEAQFTQCRIGFDFDGTDDGSDTGADREQVSVTVTKYRQN